MKPTERRGDSRTANRAADPAWLREIDGGVLIFVHLQPGARRTALCGEHGGRLKVAVAAPPLDGRANDALTAWIAAQLNLSRRQVHVAAGVRSRDKTLHAEGVDAARVLGCLAPQ